MSLAIVFGLGSHLLKAQASMEAILEAPVPEITETTLSSGSAKHLTLVNPPALINPTDLSRAGWSYFWMFSDGTFLPQDYNQLDKSFPRATTAVVALRGKYQDGAEPPLTRRSIAVGGGTSTVLPSVLDGKTSREDSIHPQFRAARPGDSIYFAVVVRNRIQEGTRSGKVLLRFPSRSFEYGRQVFPANNIAAESGEQPHLVGVASIDGSVRTWRINNLPAGEERTFFVALKVKDGADTIPHIIAIDLQWDDDAINSTPYPNLFYFPPSAPSEEGIRFGADSRTTSPSVNFRGDSYTAINVNRSRDPNGLVVFPSVVPPSNACPAHQFRYEVHVENLGTRTANNVGIGAYLDGAYMDKPSFFYDPTDKSGFPYPANTDLYSLSRFPGNSDSVKWVFRGANLAGRGTAATLLENPTPNGALNNKAQFHFDIKFTGEKILTEEQKIPAYIIVSMMNNNIGAGDAEFVVEDWERSKVENIHVASPPRLPYGSIFGGKVYRFLANPDSAGTQGFALTARLPLFRPRQYLNENGQLYKSPHLFWQLEAGLGRSTFLSSAHTQRYETRYVQLTPVQLRYIQPIRSPYFCAGVSAAYNVAYAYKGLSGGREKSAPSGFGKRLEHEFAVSLDVQNAIDVPSVTLGVGYKWRQSQFFGTTSNFKYPFAYAQIEVVRLAKRFAKVWQTVYRW